MAEWEPTGNQFAARCCIEKMVGEGDNRKQVNLEVGDRVILRQSILQAYTKVDREQNTVLVDEADILAVVEE